MRCKPSLAGCCSQKIRPVLSLNLLLSRSTDTARGHNMSGVMRLQAALAHVNGDTTPRKRGPRAPPMGFVTSPAAFPLASAAGLRAEAAVPPARHFNQPAISSPVPSLDQTGLTGCGFFR